MSQPITRRADQLVVGDVIPNDYLPLWGDLPGEVIFVDGPYDLGGTSRVFIAFKQPDGYRDGMTLLNDASLHDVIPAPPAETGQNYSRADDGEDPQPLAGRTPTHIGDVKSAITMDGHRDGEPVITGEAEGEAAHV